MCDMSSYTEITVQSSLEKLRSIENQILDTAEQSGFNSADMFAIRLCLEEALTNAVRHGNHEDMTKSVTVRYRLTEIELEIIVEDQGSGFNPSQVPDPRCEQNISKPGGRGLLLMKSYMDKVEYLGRGNIVHLIKRRNR